MWELELEVELDSSEGMEMDEMEERYPPLLVWMNDFYDAIATHFYFWMSYHIPTYTLTSQITRLSTSDTCGTIVIDA